MGMSISVLEACLERVCEAMVFVVGCAMIWGLVHVSCSEGYIHLGIGVGAYKLHVWRDVDNEGSQSCIWYLPRWGSTSQWSVQKGVDCGCLDAAIQVVEVHTLDRLERRGCRFLSDAEGGRKHLANAAEVQNRKYA